MNSTTNNYITHFKCVNELHAVETTDTNIRNGERWKSDIGEENRFFKIIFFCYSLSFIEFIRNLTKAINIGYKN